MIENFPKNRIGLSTVVAQLVERLKFKDAGYPRREGNVLNSSPNRDNLLYYNKVLSYKKIKKEEKRKRKIN